MACAWLKTLQRDEQDSLASPGLALQDGRGYPSLSSGLLGTHVRLKLAEIQFWEPETWNLFSFLILTLTTEEGNPLIFGLKHEWENPVF